MKEIKKKTLDINNEDLKNFRGNQTDIEANCSKNSMFYNKGINLRRIFENLKEFENKGTKIIL